MWVDYFSGIGLPLQISDFCLFLPKHFLVSLLFLFLHILNLHAFNQLEIFFLFFESLVHRMLQILQSSHQSNSFLYIVLVDVLDSGELDVVVRNCDVA